MTAIVGSGSGEGGGATYTGIHGGAYGVFVGGGYGSTAYVNVYAWPAQPANPSCTRGS